MRMAYETRGAAKVTYGNGEVQHWLPSPDIPYERDEAKVLTEIMSLCLKGDIVSFEPVEVQVTVPDGERGYRIVPESAVSSDA
jgi:hypothetical protein